MRPYFQKSDELAKLNAACESWLGCPYLHMGCNKGGVDCTKFIGLVLCEIGVLSSIDKEVYYSRDWHLHGNKEVVLESFLEHCKALANGFTYQLSDFTSESDLLAGDVLCISLNGRLCNHTAFFLGSNKICHCVQRLGVTKAQLNPQWQGKVKKVFRLLEQE